MNARHNRNRRADIRQALLGAPDGMTVRELRNLLNVDRRVIDSAIHRMPDVYIDRWKAVRISQPNGGGRIDWAAVYCLCDMPSDAPKPERKATEDDL